MSDINNDGLMGLANDTVQNFLFINRRDGTFEETGLMAEVAYSEDGLPRSGDGCTFCSSYLKTSLCNHCTSFIFSKYDFAHSGP